MGVTNKVWCEKCLQEHSGDLKRMKQIPRYCGCGNDLWAQMSGERSSRGMKMALQIKGAV